MKETMTSRQRLLKALNHEIPDRVPIDLGGFQTGIHRKAYENLLKHFGIKDEIQILDPVQQLAVPCEEILKRFRVDIRYIWPQGPEGFDGSIKLNNRGGRLWYDFTDEFGVVWSMPDDQKLYMDISRHPLADVTIEELKERPFPDGSDTGRFAAVREKALKIREESPYAVSTTIGGSMYEYSWYQRGLERWFMDMIENPDFCEVLLDKMLAFWKDYYTGYMGQVGDMVDVVQIGDDVAGQDGPLFSPAFYRSIIKPRLRELIRHIKSLTSAKIWYHTCGGCTRLIPDLIECGIDILNPLQISANNMDPRQLKKEFGQKVVLWGGACDTQHLLPFATPQEVAKQVRANMEIFKKGGGYVFNNVHNIQADVPVENIIAMFDAAYEAGFYNRHK